MTILGELQARTKVAQHEQAVLTRLKNEALAKQAQEQDEEQFQRGHAASFGFFEKLKAKLIERADAGKDNCRIKGGDDITTPYGRGWHQSAEPLVKGLGIEYEFFRVWHELYDPENGKEDGGYYDYGVALWWGKTKPDTKRNFPSGQDDWDGM